MASDIFLKLTGIDGEAQDDKHTKEIEIRSFHIDAQQSTGQIAPNQSRVTINDIVVEKFVDASSPKLHAYCYAGKPIARATITQRKAGGNAIEFLVLEMDTVRVSSFAIIGNDSQDRPVEHLTLAFDKIVEKYKTQKADGSPGPDITSGWDLAKNKPTS